MRSTSSRKSRKAPPTKRKRSKTTPGICLTTKHTNRHILYFNRRKSLCTLALNETIYLYYSNYAYIQIKIQIYIPNPYYVIERMLIDYTLKNSFLYNCFVFFISVQLYCLSFVFKIDMLLFFSVTKYMLLSGIS